MKKEPFNYSKLIEIANHLGLPVKKGLDIFWMLKLSGIENNQLVKKVGVSQNVLNQIKVVVSDLLMPTSNITQLNDQGEEAISKLFATGQYKPEETMWSFLEDEPGFLEIVNLLHDLNERRAIPIREYDQFTATIETTAKRAILLDFFKDIEGKRVLFLGDDDFTSVAVNKIGGATKVSVLDIDQRVLDGIKGASTRIETIKYDVRKTLPSNVKGNFDVVFTDPPYTQNGINLFLSRAIEALDIGMNKSARVYFCYGNSDRAKERFLPIYGIVVKSGMMLRWVFDKFNRYDGAESIGSSSTLFVCDVTPKTRPLINGEFSKNIYTLKK